MKSCLGIISEVILGMILLTTFIEYKIPIIIITIIAIITTILMRNFKKYREELHWENLPKEEKEKILKREDNIKYIQEIVMKDLKFNYNMPEHLTIH